MALGWHGPRLGERHAWCFARRVGLQPIYILLQRVYRSWSVGCTATSHRRSHRTAIFHPNTPLIYWQAIRNTYITRAGHNNFTTAVMANQEFYEGLSEEEQTMIDDAISVAFDYIIDYQDGLTEESLEKIKEAKPSMTITDLSEEERQPFMDTAESVEQEFLEIGGDQAQEILDQMKADLEAAASES